jgi:hypothetical protein
MPAKKKPYRVKPIFLTKEEVERCRARGVEEGGIAILAVAIEKGHAASDQRDERMQLVDMLCSLRFWARDKGVSFHGALQDSERHFMIENGKLAENHASIT